MKSIYKLALLLVLGFASASCSNSDEGIKPDDISDISGISGPGYINLKWVKPEGDNILYTRVEYFDHLEQRLMWRLSTTDTIRIPNTRAKYGEYEFSLQTYSKTEDKNSNIHTIKMKSGKAPATEIATPLTLESEQLSTNAQEPSEGHIKNLVDGDVKTYFHSTWSGTPPAKPHWIQINLAKELESFRFQYAPRNNGNNKPTDFDLLGSMDGKEWTLIKNFTKEADKLPTGSTEEYKSPTIKSEKPFKFLRLSVNKTNSGSVFWTMSEFRLYDIKIVDPEAEN